MQVRKVFQEEQQESHISSASTELYTRAVVKTDGGGRSGFRINDGGAREEIRKKIQKRVF